MVDSVGLIGVGKMGTPMTRRLVETGHKVITYDIDAGALKRAETCGAETASSPKAVAERCNPIITILPNSEAVESAILGVNGVLEGGKKGDVLIEMTTAYPLSSKKIANKLREKGMRMLDAPVSGGVQGAREGTLSIMVGGDGDILEMYMPLLRVLGSKIIHMGSVGNGHTMKAVNNFLSACTMVATSEGLALATKAGLDPGKVIEVLQNSSGRSYSTDYKFPKYVLTRKFDDGFRMGLQNKDLKIFTDLGRDLDCPVFLGNMVQQIIGLATSLGYKEKGHTSIAEFMERWAEVKIQAEMRKDRS